MINRCKAKETLIISQLCIDSKSAKPYHTSQDGEWGDTAVLHQLTFSACASLVEHRGCKAEHFEVAMMTMLPACSTFQ